MYINGKTITNLDREKIIVLNPATEEILGEVYRGNTQDAFEAIRAAKQAFPIWKFTPASERAAMLHQAAAKMREHHDDLVKLLTQEEGKPVPENDEEWWWAEETFDYYAEIGRHDRGSVIPPGDSAQFNFVISRN